MTSFEELKQKHLRKEKSQSRFHRSREDMGKFYVFIWQFILAAQWAWFNVGKPVFDVISVPVKKVFQLYRKLWSFVVYYRDEFDNLRFSKTRAGLFLTGSALFVYLLFIPALVFTADAGLYFMTGKHNETVYLTKSEEIDPDNNIHSILGNGSLPLDGDTGFYFRVEPSLFNQVWSFINKGSMFYPDYVASAVAPGLNKCEVTSYGIRVKTLMRRLDIYPKILAVKCDPVVGSTP